MIEAMASPHVRVGAEVGCGPGPAPGREGAGADGVFKRSPPAAGADAAAGETGAGGISCGTVNGFWHAGQFKT